MNKNLNKIYFKDNSFHFKKIDNSIEIDIEEYNIIVQETYRGKKIHEENGKIILIDEDIEELKQQKIREIKYKANAIIESEENYPMFKQSNIQREYLLNLEDAELEDELSENLSQNLIRQSKEQFKEKFKTMNDFINNIRSQSNKLESTVINLTSVDQIDELEIAYVLPEVKSETNTETEPINIESEYMEQ